jgi:glucose/arabinose dehydrogenase
MLALAPSAEPAAAATGLTVTPVMTGLSNPWDVAFAPDGAMFVTERSGRLSVRLPDGRVRQLTIDRRDLWASGETGLMGIEVDPEFASNRRIYTCQGTTDNGNTVQVVAWTVDGAYTTATRVNDPLVGGIDGTSGRHGGCQLRIDTTGALLVGTGDAANGVNPQSPTSLSGKVLRVDRFSGAGVRGNPFFNEGGNRARMLTWGHRNVQGLAVQPGTGAVYSVEHGPDRDDEINRLSPGRNYGWDPVPGYNESVPMTDFRKFPGAVGAVWSSGPTTFAVSGATFLRGAGWGSWEGALAVSALKDQRLRVLFFDGAGRVSGQVIPAELDRRFGRLRGAELGPGGLLFVTTDNGGGRDRVLAIAPPDVGPGGGSSAAPAPGVDIVTRGIDDRVWLRTWTGSAWRAWSSLGGVATSDPDTSTWGGDRLDVVVRGGDGAVWHRARQNGRWSAWSSLGGFAWSGPSVSSSGPGRLEVFVRGGDGALWVRQFANGAWSGWSSLGGRITSDPDAAAVGPGRVDVYARGADGALWRRRTIGGAWQPWELIGGRLTSGPTVAAAPGDRVDVFVRGTDDALWHTWSIGGSPFAAWDLGIGRLASAPDANWRGGFLDAFVRGVDGGLYQVAWVGNRWIGPIKLS